MIEASEWSVYIISREFPAARRKLSPGSRDFYTGISNDVTRRLDHHNAGLAKSTRGRKWKLVLRIDFLMRGQAARIEKWLKNGDTATKRNWLIKKYAEASNKITFGQDLFEELFGLPQWRLDEFD